MQYSFLQQKIFGFFTVLAMFVLCLPTAHAVFINEIHYDNTGADTNEAVELVGVAGQNLAGWSLLFYNGSTGSVYKNVGLSGVFANTQQGMGVLGFAVSGIQNGSPDGVALIDDNSNVLQFLSYEGSLLAADGAAAGLMSVDIGVAEDSATPANDSLQLVGGGRSYGDFVWAVGAASFGGVNQQQIFTAPAGLVSASVPEPATGILLVLGLLLLMIMRNTKCEAARLVY